MTATHALKWVQAAIALLLWQVLLRAQNPGLMTDDSGEIVTAAWSLGIGHSPGFPLHMLLSKIALNIPVGTPAFRLNLLASLFAVLAVYFVVQACRELWETLRPEGVDPVLRESALLLAALSLFFCESVFAQSLTAKGGIYTFTLMGYAVLLRACIGEVTDRKILWAFFFWCVGLGDHWAMQILLGLMLVVRFGPALVRWSAPRWALLLSLVGAGVSSFLYLPIRARFAPPLNWEDPQSLSSFWSVLSRASAPPQESASRTFAELVNNTRVFLGVVWTHWWPGFALLSIAGFILLWKRQRGVAWACAAGYTATVLAVIRASHFDGMTLYLESNYLVVTQALPAVLGFAGALFLADRWAASRPRTVRIVVAVCLLGSMAWGARVFVRQDKSRYTLAEDHGVNLFGELPWNAAILLDTDVTVMPALYQRYVQLKRMDLVVVPLSLIYSPWGFRQVMSEYQARVNDTVVVSGFRDAVQILTDPARFRCSSFFYAYDKGNLMEAGMSDLVKRFSPWGIADRLGAGTPQVEEASRSVWAVTSRFRLRNLEEAPDLPLTEFTSNVYRHNYSRPHAAMGNAFLGQKQIVPAVEHYRRALEIYPRWGSIYLKLSKYFEDAGDPEMAAVFCKREIEVKPDLADLHFLLGDLLMNTVASKEAIEAYDRALKLAPGSPEVKINRDNALGALITGSHAGSEAKEREAKYQAMAERFEKEGSAYLAEAAREAAAYCRTSVDNTRQ